MASTGMEILNVFLRWNDVIRQMDGHDFGDMVIQHFPFCEWPVGEGVRGRGQWHPWPSEPWGWARTAAAGGRRTAA